MRFWCLGGERGGKGRERKDGRGQGQGEGGQVKWASQQEDLHQRGSCDAVFSDMRGDGEKSKEGEDKDKGKRGGGVEEQEELVVEPHHSRRSCTRGEAVMLMFGS